ncbi:unnamed protein product, partial [Darwinula stevensoni]
MPSHRISRERESSGHQRKKKLRKRKPTSKSLDRKNNDSVEAHLAGSTSMRSILEKCHDDRDTRPFSSTKGRVSSFPERYVPSKEILNKAASNMIKVLNAAHRSEMGTLQELNCSDPDDPKPSAPQMMLAKLPSKRYADSPASPRRRGRSLSPKRQKKPCFVDQIPKDFMERIKRYYNYLDIPEADDGQLTKKLIEEIKENCNQCMLQDVLQLLMKEVPSPSSGRDPPTTPLNYHTAAYSCLSTFTFHRGVHRPTSFRQPRNAIMPSDGDVKIHRENPVVTVSRPVPSVPLEPSSNIVGLSIAPAPSQHDNQTRHAARNAKNRKCKETRSFQASSVNPDNCESSDHLLTNTTSETMLQHIPTQYPQGRSQHPRSQQQESCPEGLLGVLPGMNPFAGNHLITSYYDVPLEPRQNPQPASSSSLFSYSSMDVGPANPQQPYLNLTAESNRYHSPRGNTRFVLMNVQPRELLSSEEFPSAPLFNENHDRSIFNTSHLFCTEESSGASQLPTFVSRGNPSVTYDDRGGNTRPDDSWMKVGLPPNPAAHPEEGFQRPPPDGMKHKSLTSGHSARYRSRQMEPGDPIQFVGYQDHQPKSNAATHVNGRAATDFFCPSLVSSSQLRSDDRGFQSSVPPVHVSSYYRGTSYANCGMDAVDSRQSVNLQQFPPTQTWHQGNTPVRIDAGLLQASTNNPSNFGVPHFHNNSSASYRETGPASLGFLDSRFINRNWEPNPLPSNEGQRPNLPSNNLYGKEASHRNKAVSTRHVPESPNMYFLLQTILSPDTSVSDRTTSYERPPRES